MHPYVFFSKTPVINWGNIENKKKVSYSPFGTVTQLFRPAAHIVCSRAGPSEDVQGLCGQISGKNQENISRRAFKVFQVLLASVLENRNCQISISTLEKGDIYAVAFKEIIAVTALSWKKRLCRTIKNPLYNSWYLEDGFCSYHSEKIFLHVILQKEGKIKQLRTTQGKRLTG